MYQKSLSLILAQTVKSPTARLTPASLRFSQVLLQNSRRTFTSTRFVNMPEFKLSGVSKSELKPGFMKEVEVEGIKDAKLLLVQVGDKLQATSPKCTHYGAPLVKGTLTASGRIVCPWHGSCFSTFTGDIEDAPGLDAIYAFPVTVKGDEYTIQAEEKQITSGSRKPDTCKVNNASDETVLIVGGGSAAVGTIEGLRQEGYKGHITVLSKEPYLPIDRTKISKALITDVSKIELRDAAFYKDIGVDFHTSTIVKSIDFDGHRVTTEDGKDYKYKKVVLATGGTPKKLPMDGFKKLKNIFVVRTIQDAQEIIGNLGTEGGKKVVIIGSSFIGMEVAVALSGKKHEVTVVGMEKVPLEKVMGEKIGGTFRTLVEKKGVKFYMDSGVEDAKPSSSDSSVVGSVELKGGEKLECDAVVLGVGVSPETSYLDKGMLEKDGSVSVNENFELKGKKDAYAIGDIATYPYRGPGGGPDSKVRIEHWNVAQNSGRAVASHITHGKDTTPFIPIFWSALGTQLRYCGHTPDGFDDLIVQGNLDEAKFAAFYTKGETVVAVATMGKDPMMTQASELMRRQAMPSRTELKGGVDILNISVPAEIAQAA